MVEQTISRISVLSFNILYGGTYLGQPLEQTARVIERSEADIIVLCEEMGSARLLADQLTLYCHEVVAPPYWNSVAVLSRFPMIEKFSNGVRIELVAGNTVSVFGIHLTSSPYQPYQVRDNTFGGIGEVIKDAEKTRGHELDHVLAEMTPSIDKGERVLLCGDFNEPSHLDWTDRAAVAGFHFRQMISWPCSRKIIAAGMKDSLRMVCPDELGYPALTWTPVPGEGVGGSEDKEEEVHDRIDFVYHAGGGIRPVSVEIIGEIEGQATLVVSPYPSDHRAVMVRFLLD